MRVEVINTITFLTKGISKEKTTASTSVKLVFWVKVGDITKTSEHAKVRLIGQVTM